MRSGRSICAPPRLSRSFPPNVAFETLPMLVSGWRWSFLSSSLKEGRWALPLPTPLALSSRRSMVWCPWLCAQSGWLCHVACSTHGTDPGLFSFLKGSCDCPWNPGGRGKESASLFFFSFLFCSSNTCGRIFLSWKSLKTLRSEICELWTRLHVLKVVEDFTSWKLWKTFCPETRGRLYVLKWLYYGLEWQLLYRSLYIIAVCTWVMRNVT